MSLLDKGNKDVLLYPEEVTTDRDGNIRTQAAKTPIPLRVSLQARGQSGTASRRAEQDNEGFETEQVMRMRVRRQDAHIPIGAQAKVEFDGQIWSVFGDGVPYMGSAKTAHTDYQIWRS